MEHTHLIYRGQVFQIEAVVLPNGDVPAEEWLESLSQKHQQKFASLFAMLADVGKLWNERKFKHLEGSDQIFEFKVDDGRILCFFFVGQRVILTHGFAKKSAKTPRVKLNGRRNINQTLYRG
ncbi:MAG: type II toxin-antitoxin system RelE/ParE family toxin [Bdellovibrionales bacterium]|nr:type II toxin-antitoxin system RelE/ParE family toxin [Bdellovibrionales bacterium]